MSPRTQEVRKGKSPGTPRVPRWRPIDPPARGSDAADPATPLLRAARETALEPCDWGSALTAFCNGFRRVQSAHGARSLSWAVSQSLTNEELAFSAALACDGLGF